jgi:hypothetical protein
VVRAAELLYSIGERNLAMRAAVRLGPSYGSIVKTCVAVASKEKKARALLEKVPSGSWELAHPNGRHCWS